MVSHSMECHFIAIPGLAYLGQALLFLAGVLFSWFGYAMLCCAVHGFALLSLTFISLATISLALLGLAGLKR